MNEANRRTAERHTVTLPARYQALGYDGDELTRSGTIVDVSDGGLMLVADEPLSYGSRVRISFFDDKGWRHEVLCLVVRSQGMAGAGVSFVEIDHDTLDFVRAATLKPE